MASLSVPAGSYVITGRFDIFNAGVATSGDCTLFAGATEIDNALFDLTANAGDVNQVPVTVHATRTVAGTTSLQVLCEELGGNLSASNRRLTAVRVETLTNQ